VRNNKVDDFLPHVINGSIIHDVATSLITHVDSVVFINAVIVIVVIDVRELHELRLSHSELTYIHTITGCLGGLLA